MGGVFFHVTPLMEEFSGNAYNAWVKLDKLLKHQPVPILTDWPAIVNSLAHDIVMAL